MEETRREEKTFSTLLSGSNSVWTTPPFSILPRLTNCAPIYFPALRAVKVKEGGAGEIRCQICFGRKESERTTTHKTDFLSFPAKWFIPRRPCHYMQISRRNGLLSSHISLILAANPTFSSRQLSRFQRGMRCKYAKKERVVRWRC